MNLKAALFLSIGLVSILWASNAFQASAIQDEERPRTVRWEYRAEYAQGVTKDENTKKLNELGNQGWELVTVETVIHEGGLVATNYYFKRPK